MKYDVVVEHAGGRVYELYVSLEGKTYVSRTLVDSADEALAYAHKTMVPDILKNSVAFADIAVADLENSDRAMFCVSPTIVALDAVVEAKPDPTVAWQAEYLYNPYTGVLYEEEHRLAEEKAQAEAQAAAEAAEAARLAEIANRIYPADYTYDPMTGFELPKERKVPSGGVADAEILS